MRQAVAFQFLLHIAAPAQTADWVPAHLFATLQAAYRHRGFAFVRILQRCPHFTADMYGDVVKDPSRVELMVHEDGINVPSIDGMFDNKIIHTNEMAMAAQAAAGSATSATSTAATAVAALVLSGAAIVVDRTGEVQAESSRCLEHTLRACGTPAGRSRRHLSHLEFSQIPDWP